MKNTSANTARSIKTLALILCVGALPLLLGVTGCYTDSGREQSTGEQIDDHNTSLRVNAALADDTEYKFDGVNVETFNGTVQLSGFVASGEQKNRAGDIARKFTSVKAIENNITVKKSAD